MSSIKYRKGILLAGGTGQRLKPLTSAISKQLLPVYDKPMIYYPLSTLMLSGIRDILVITTPKDKEVFQGLFGDGKDWGLNFTYSVQERPEGIAQALNIGSDFIKGNPVALALGDNLFHGKGLTELLNSANNRSTGATIFAYPVRDPERYGVVKFNKSGTAISIEEKPSQPTSQYAVTGLYFYDETVIERAKKLKFSNRGELEITSLNQSYLDDGLLNVELMGRGMAWLDTGTFDSFNEASSYIRTLEHRQGLKVGCPEEIAWRKKWISEEQLKKLAKPLKASGYGEYLLRLLEISETENE